MRWSTARCSEPIFALNSYRKDGAALVPDGGTPAPGDAEAVDQINVKHGYQIGSEQISWFLGKWAAGALNDPVRAFRESRDASARGDWPLLSLSDKDKFSTDGHVVLPYRWDPATEAEIIPVEQGGRDRWTIFVANPNSPAAGALPSTDDEPDCTINIMPFEGTWEMELASGDLPPWSGSRLHGGRLLMMPYSVLSSTPTSPADLIVTLLEAIAAGALIILAGDDGSEQITDSNQRTIFRTEPDGNRRINEDAASRIPDLALLPVHERGAASREIYVWRPNPATAGTQLQHKMQGPGELHVVAHLAGPVGLHSGEWRCDRDDWGRPSADRAARGRRPSRHAHHGSRPRSPGAPAFDRGLARKRHLAGEVVRNGKFHRFVGPYSARASAECGPIAHCAQ